jgi:hypothetical protein
MSVITPSPVGCWSFRGDFHHLPVETQSNQKIIIRRILHADTTDAAGSPFLPFTDLPPVVKHGFLSPGERLSAGVPFNILIRQRVQVNTFFSTLKLLDSRLDGLKAT